MDLFNHAAQKRIEQEQPLAARLRPRTLDEFVGQDHILAPGRLLRRAIQADQLSSLIFFGPPGTGKTTLASVIANTTQSHFEILNAVLAGVADIRRVTEEAQHRRVEHNKRTILFVDEVHRWNKAQQDALLPWVENGTIVLIGATTENPYFTVNRALVSRSRIFQLQPLNEDHLRQVARNALTHQERGYGKLPVELAPKALDHIVNIANGDARAVLNALELAVETTPPAEDGVIHIDLNVAEESIQRRAVLYDKEGDYHFDTISAFIKSLRGSDPDAAVYWLAKMVYAGEDPRFLFRRMLIFCGEDIGLADPNALVVTTAAAEAFDRVGMPEGRYHLGMAALYLATAPKSNSVFAFFDAMATVGKEREDDVPNHLKDASRDKESFGHGQGYLYPHAYRDHWVAQQYLPASLQGKLFYQPGNLGFEQTIAAQTQRRREAQLAATLENNAPDGTPPEILSFSPPDRGFDRWLDRTTSGASERLSELRDRLFTAITWQRHHVVLDANADSGLLVWETVRRTPEGGVWARVSSAEAQGILASQARHCPELRAPQVLTGSLEELPELLARHCQEEIHFDRIIGRNCLATASDKVAALSRFHQLLRPDEGTLGLIETFPLRTQRLWQLLPEQQLPEQLLARLTAAEESIYTDPERPELNWNEANLEKWLATAGFLPGPIQTVTQTVQQRIDDRLLNQWFEPSTTSTNRTYAEHLMKVLTPDECRAVELAFRTALSNRQLPWQLTSLILTASRAEG